VLRPMRTRGCTAARIAHTAMSCPSFAEICDALLSGMETALADPVLAHGRLRTDETGRPRVHGGTFALVFEIDGTDGRRYALRCFHKALDAIDLRYDAIGRHLVRCRSPHFVDFEFQPRGIHTESGRYPVLRMDWAPGPTLAAYVAAHRRDPARLLETRDALRSLARNLAANGVAHGDIQPTNLVVESPSRLVLVDYDGLFVPDLSPFRSPELGQRNFQHPGRRARHFDAALDAFSIAVVDLALDALRLAPELWEETESGPDAFLLRAADFADPASSPVFRRISRIAGLKERAERLAGACLSTFSAIPPLEQLLADSAPGAPRIVFKRDGGGTSRAPYVSPYVILDAIDFAHCCARVGDRVEMIGQVHRRVAETPAGTTHAVERIELGPEGHDMVCVRLPAAVADEAFGRAGSAAARDWLCASGLLEPVTSEIVDGRRQKFLTLAVDDAGQVQCITREEAVYRAQGIGRHPATDADQGVRTDPVEADRAEPALAGREQTAAAVASTVPPHRIAVPPAPNPAPPRPQDRPVTIPTRRGPPPARGTWLGTALVVAIASTLWWVSSPMHTPPLTTTPVSDGPGDRPAEPVPAAINNPPGETRVALPVAAGPDAAETAPSPPAPPTWTPLEGARSAELAGTRVTVETSDDEPAAEFITADGVPVPGLSARHIRLLYQASYGEKQEAIAGILRCPAMNAGRCAPDRPFWLEAGPDEAPRIRLIPGLGSGADRIELLSTDLGPRIDLGLWNGERRSVDLTGAGNLLVARQLVPPRPLDRADCRVVLRSLEACAASRDCSSVAASAGQLSDPQRERLESMYHRSTGLDAAAFRAICVRSCELGLTPSAAFVRRAACNGSAEGQWSGGDGDSLLD
jgi:hypothetical protein